MSSSPGRQNGNCSPAFPDSTTWRFSAPGKIILFGEHAVVYGKTAVAGSIGFRTSAELKFRPPSSTNPIDDQIELNLPDLNFCRSFARRKVLEAAERLEHLCLDDEGDDDLLPPSPELAIPIAQQLCGPLTNEKFDVVAPGSRASKYAPAHVAMLTFTYVALGVLARRRELPVFKLKVSSKVPIRVGLGSSGAFCVTICTALLRLAGLIDEPTSVSRDGTGLTWSDQDQRIIEIWATAAESLIHGKSSGLDVAVCTRGGLIAFVTGERPQPVGSHADLRLIIVNTKVERNTHQMVKTVRDNREKFPPVINKIFDAIDEISKEASRLLTNPQCSNTNSGTSSSCSSCKSSSVSPASMKKKIRNGSQTSESNSGNELIPINGDNGDNVTVIANGFTTLKIGSTGTTSTDSGLAKTNYESLQDLCRINNHLLNALGVGHAKITQICSLLARYGIHTKLSGAGGGGTVFAFITKEASSKLLNMIKSELEQQGFELWQPVLGGSGVLQLVD